MVFFCVCVLAAATNVCNSHTHFQCDNGECIDLSLVCNGNNDCADWTDEPLGGICTINECENNNGHCDHECNDLPSGYYCSCRAGFELRDDNRTCYDINECKANPPPCSQACHNTEGSFFCKCSEGFVLEYDGKTCKASGPSPLLIFANRRDIREFNVKTNEYRQLFQNLRSAVAVDFHFQSNRVFWTDVADSHIQR